MHDVSNRSFTTVWFRGHPYPVSMNPHGPLTADAGWYVLLEDGQWYRVRARHEGSERDGSVAVESDVVAWLAQHATAPPPESALHTVREYVPIPRDRNRGFQVIHFANGAFASDFVRRLNVLFDGRATRLIIPSMPVVIYGPALIDTDEAVTLYAGRGAVALARYVGLDFPRPGAEVDAATLEAQGLRVVFGPTAARSIMDRRL